MEHTCPVVSLNLKCISYSFSEPEHLYLYKVSFISVGKGWSFSRTLHTAFNVLLKFGFAMSFVMLNTASGYSVPGSSLFSNLNIVIE